MFDETKFARVAKLVYAPDLKSDGRKVMPVRLRPRAPFMVSIMQLEKNNVICYGGGQHYVITELVRIKQDDGSWSDGVSYRCLQTASVYVRRLDQLEKFTKIADFY